MAKVKHRKDILEVPFQSHSVVANTYSWQLQTLVADRIIKSDKYPDTEPIYTHIGKLDNYRKLHVLTGFINSFYLAYNISDMAGFFILQSYASNILAGKKQIKFPNTYFSSEIKHALKHILHDTQSFLLVSLAIYEISKVHTTQCALIKYLNDINPAIINKQHNLKTIMRYADYINLATESIYPDTILQQINKIINKCNLPQFI